LAIGIPLGAIGAYAGGKTDMVFSRLVDLLLSFPSILLAICIAAAMGTGLKTVIIAVGIVGVPQFARQVRASVLQIQALDYVSASRALGAGHGRILFLDILPNALGPIIVLATLGVGSSILTAAGLSFLGLGVETGTPEWGAMLHDGYNYWRRSSSLALFSGLAISTTVLAFNLFGDGLRDALDPRSHETK
jgi:peptide/nickel transport system permease protein